MLMPWHGLFAQLLLADRVLLYDDVQLPHGGGASRGFITRVQIKTPKGTEWLSVPIRRAGQGKQKICEALVEDSDWRQDHVARIERAYRSAPNFEPIWSLVVKPIYGNASERLADFLVGSMEAIAAFLGMPTPFERSSQGDWANDLSSTARVVAICKKVNAGRYLSGNGGMKYLDYEPFEDADVKVHFMRYSLNPYNQLHGDFTPYVSLIDLLFNVPLEHARQHLQTTAMYWRDWPQQVGGRPIPL